MTNNSYNELKDALRTCLEQNGALPKLQSFLRAEIFKALDGGSEMKPVLADETVLLNQLIMEYLEWHGWEFTKGVLAAESNQPETSLTRTQMMQEFGLKLDSVKTSKAQLYVFSREFMDVSTVDTTLAGGRPLLYHLCFATRDNENKDNQVSAMHQQTQQGNKAPIPSLYEAVLAARVEKELDELLPSMTTAVRESTNKNLSAQDSEVIETLKKAP